MMFVGREQELKAIQDAWSRSLSGTPQCVALIGESRLGKTRLIQEFYCWLNKHEDPQDYWPESLEKGGDSLHINPVFETHSSTSELPPWLWWGLRWSRPGLRNPAENGYCAAIAYADHLRPHVEAVRQHFEVAAAERKAKIGVGKSFANLATGGLAGAATEIFERAADWMDLRAGRVRLHALVLERGAFLRESELEQLLSLLLSFTTTHSIVEGGIPLVLVLDDVHWADRETLRFVQRLCREMMVRGKGSLGIRPRLLILVTSWEREWNESDRRPLSSTASSDPETWLDLVASLRQQAQRDALGGIDLCPIRLARLQDHLEPVVAEILSGTTDLQRTLVASLAGGSPGLLAEVLVKLSKRSWHLFEQGNPAHRLTPQGEKVLKEMRVDYHELIEERLNALSSLEKTLLRLASYLGVQFSQILLEAVVARFPTDFEMGLHNEGVRLALDRADRDLVIVQCVGERLYEFRIPAYRDVLFRQLTETEQLFETLNTAVPDVLSAMLSDDLKARSHGERGAILSFMSEDLARRLASDNDDRTRALLLSAWAERLQDLQVQGLADSSARLFVLWMQTWRGTGPTFLPMITAERYAIVLRAGLASGHDLSVWEVAEEALTGWLVDAADTQLNSTLASLFMRFGGEAAMRMDRHDVACDLLVRCHSLALRAVAQYGASSERIRAVAVSEFLLSDISKIQRNPVEASEVALSSLNGFRTCLQMNESAERIRDVILSKMQVGKCMLSEGRIFKALQALHSAESLSKKLIEQYGAAADYLSNQAAIKRGIAWALMKDQRESEGTEYWRGALELSERVVRDFGPTYERLRDIYLAKLGLADCLRDQGSFDLISSLYDDAATVADKIVQEFRPTAEARVEACVPYARKLEIVGATDSVKTLELARCGLIVLGVPSGNTRSKDAEGWFHSAIRCINDPKEHVNLAWVLRSGYWQHSLPWRRQLSRADWL